MSSHALLHRRPRSKATRDHASSPNMNCMVFHNIVLTQTLPFYWVWKKGLKLIEAMQRVYADTVYRISLSTHAPNENPSPLPTPPRPGLDSKSLLLYRGQGHSPVLPRLTAVRPGYGPLTSPNGSSHCLLFPYSSKGNVLWVCLI